MYDKKVATKAYLWVMCEITIEVVCPHCHRAKVNKNGRKPSGTQSFICRLCKKQFQSEYIYNGTKLDTKKLIISLLLRNGGVRDIETILGVGRRYVLNALLLYASKCLLKPRQGNYKSVRIHEFLSRPASAAPKTQLGKLYGYPTGFFACLFLIVGGCLRIYFWFCAPNNWLAGFFVFKFM